MRRARGGIYKAPAEIDTGEPYQFAEAEFQRYQAALQSLRNGERIDAPEDRPSETGRRT